MKPARTCTTKNCDRKILEQTRKHLANREAGLRSTLEQKAAWRKFYDQCAPRIRRFARACHMCGDEIDDCFQEVWRELLVRLPAFHLDEERGQFDTWLYSIVRSKAIDLHRRHKNDCPTCAIELLSEFPDQHAPDSRQPDDQELLTAALAHLRGCLSPCNYQILHLRLVEQRPVAQVAEKLNVTHQQVWYRYHRAKKQLEEITQSLTDGVLLKQLSAKLTKEKPNKKTKTAQGDKSSAVSRSVEPNVSLRQGGSPVDLVFKSLELGRQCSTPEWKVEWNTENTPTPNLYIRKLSMVAYAEMCGPEDILNDHWAQITNAAVAAGVAAGIATIIATPTAAVKVFRAEFEKQLCGKVGRDVPEKVHVGLCARQEANGPWCECE